MVECKTTIEQCVRDIDNWMVINNLKLNQNKTEVVLINTRYRPRPPLDSLQTRTTTWNLPGPSGTQDCMNRVNLSHPPSSVEAKTDVIHNQRQKTLKVASDCYITTHFAYTVYIRSVYQSLKSFWRQIASTCYACCWDLLEIAVEFCSCSRSRLDRLVARFLRWYKVSFDKCSLWFSINFTMEGSPKKCR